MPMDFPDMESLITCARAHNFREPAANESEKHYREVLADHVRPIDPVESQEIRTGKGWDKWTEEQGAEAILAAAGRDDPPAPADRAECLAWAKMRAHRVVGLGHLPILSILKDLTAHPELQRSVRVGVLIASTVDVRDEAAVRRFIDGFN